MTTKPTLITFLLDRSSSMGIILDSTIEAFNGYLDGLRAQNGADIAFTLVTFDSISLDKICVSVPPAKAPNLSPANYVPRGSTPLIDAAVKTIRAVEKQVAERGDAVKVVICIQTDGEENCSTQHTWDELNKLIKDKTALGWEFNFMGAGIDAYQQGQKMGIAVANTMSYNSADLGQTRAAFVGRASSHAHYAAGLTSNTMISAVEKQAAGDAFDPGHNHTAGQPGGGTGGSKAPDVHGMIQQAGWSGASKWQVNPPKTTSGANARPQIVDDLDLSTQD